MRLKEELEWVSIIFMLSLISLVFVLPWYWLVVAILIYLIVVAIIYTQHKRRMLDGNLTQTNSSDIPPRRQLTWEEQMSAKPWIKINPEKNIEITENNDDWKYVWS